MIDYKTIGQTYLNDNRNRMNANANMHNSTDNIMYRFKYMNHHLIKRGLMNTAGRKRGFTGRSRDTLHKAKGITLIEA